MRRALLGALLGLVVLTGCGAPSWQSTHYAAICLNDDGVRVPDEFCAIGDPGTPIGGYGWGYAGYPRTGYLDVPLVGYPVTRTIYVSQPPSVQAIYIDRGSFTSSAAPGQRGNAQRISVTDGAATKTSVTRGGLGSTSIVEDDAVAKPTMRKITGNPPAKRYVAPPRKTKR